MRQECCGGDQNGQQAQQRPPHPCPPAFAREGGIQRPGRDAGVDIRSADALHLLPDIGASLECMAMGGGARQPLAKRLLHLGRPAGPVKSGNPGRGLCSDLARDDGRGDRCPGCPARPGCSCHWLPSHQPSIHCITANVALATCFSTALTLIPWCCAISGYVMPSKRCAR